MKNIQIIENYLDETYFNQIINTITENTFPWYRGNINLKDDGKRQFVHSFYRLGAPNSDYFNLMNPIIKKLNVASLLRLKINLLPKTNEIIKNGFHRDQEFKCKNAILYLNTNNGYTYFEDGSIVESVANRIAIFDNNLFHGGTTCTDIEDRIVLNINFMEKEPM